MFIRQISLALLVLTAAAPGAVIATTHSCTDSSGYHYSLLSTELEGDYYVYRYLVKGGAKKSTSARLAHWNVFLPDSCGATSAGTCALSGNAFEPTAQEARCNNPADAIPSQCRTRSWKTGTSADIMTFQIHKSRVMDPTGGVVTVQSQSGNQAGSNCPTCQLQGPKCASVPAADSVDDESESIFYQWIRSLTVKAKTTSTDDKDSKSEVSKTKTTSTDDKDKESKSETSKTKATSTDDKDKESKNEDSKAKTTTVDDKDKESSKTKTTSVDDNDKESKSDNDKESKSETSITKTTSVDDKGKHSENGDDKGNNDDADADKKGSSKSGEDKDTSDNADHIDKNRDDSVGEDKDSDNTDDKDKDSNKAKSKDTDSDGANDSDKDTGDDNQSKEKTDGLPGKVVNCSKTGHRLGSPGGRGKKPSWMKITGDSLMHRDHDGPFPYKGDFMGYESRHFESHRYGKNGFQYIYEQPCYNDDHTYIVTMGFAENRDNAPNHCHDGARVFSVEVNGEAFVEDLDVYKSSGGCKTAYVVSKDFNPKDGKFDFDFIPNVGSPMVSFIDVRIKDRRNLGRGCRGKAEVQSS